ncbi:MAG: hypothetical protein QOG69_1983, partial [Actinomycetota bacterium]|nr:hypothetical protein [Actinomycetota bacterium]
MAGVTVVRAGLSLVMVGRAAELRRLKSRADGLTEPRVVMLSGEAGVGKSRLVQEFVETLTDRAVLIGHAEPGPLGRPFHVLHGAIEGLVGSWTEVPQALAARTQPLRSLLAPIAPGLAGDATAAVDASIVGEQSLRAAVDLVRYLLDGRPGVLVAEDLHWADADSLLLIGRLATTPDLPLLIVGTFRVGVADSRLLADMLDRVGRQRLVEYLELRPLNDAQVAEWLRAVYGGSVSWRTASDLARRTSGNPFFLEELVSSAPGVDVDSLGDRPLPVSVSEAVLRHLDGLEDAERRIVDSAAVLGRRIPFDLLAIVSGVGEDDLIETMRMLVARGLVSEIEPDVFGFRHALTREAVASRLLGRQRRRLHEKAHAALLEMGSDDWGALAYHAAGAHLWDDVVEAARRGAKIHLRNGSTYEALRLAELGLQEVEADALLLELAARAAWACGLTDSALGYATQRAGLVEAQDDDAELCQALRMVARLKWELGDSAGRDDVVQALLVVAQRLPDGPELAYVYGYVAEVSMLAGQSADAVEWADRALELMTPDDDMRSPALVNKGSALFDMPGHFDEGAALLEEAIELSIAEQDVFSALRGLNNLLQGVLVRWEPERVWGHIARMADLVQRFGRHDWVSGLAEITAAYHSDVMGDARAACDALDAAISDSTADPGRKRSWLVSERAWLAAELNDEDASDLLVEVRALNAAAHDSALQQPHWLESLEIEIALRGGDIETVSQGLATIVERAGREEASCTLYAWTWGSGLVAAVRAGISPARATEVLETVLASPYRAMRDEDAGWTSHVRAAIAAASGDHAGAVEHFRAALDGPRRRPGAVVDAELRVGLAKSLLALGDIDEARVHIDDAGRFLSKWGGWRVDELESLRNRVNGGGARVASGQLTARELEVAALVARGLSNSEIGRALFISAKTASVHVSNILA